MALAIAPKINVILTCSVDQIDAAEIGYGTDYKYATENRTKVEYCFAREIVGRYQIEHFANGKRHRHRYGR